VLANIVSRIASLSTNSCSHCLDGRQGGHVDIKGGVGGTRLAGVGEARSEIVLARNIPIAWVSFTVTSGGTKALAHGHPKPHHVSPSKAVVSACICRGTTISPIMTSQKPNLIRLLCLIPSTSGGLNLDEVQPHGRSTAFVIHCCLSVAAELLNMQSSCVSVRIWCGPRLSPQP
jgi:hypothetical protein